MRTMTKKRTTRATNDTHLKSKAQVSPVGCPHDRRPRSLSHVSSSGSRGRVPAVASTCGSQHIPTWLDRDPHGLTFPGGGRGTDSVRYGFDATLLGATAWRSDLDLGCRHVLSSQLRIPRSGATARPCAAGRLGTAAALAGLTHRARGPQVLPFGTMLTPTSRARTRPSILSEVHSGE